MANEQNFGALWSKEKNGKVFLSGKINGVQVVAFQNTYRKEGSNQPQWNVYKARDQGERSEAHQERHAVERFHEAVRQPVLDDEEPPF